MRMLVQTGITTAAVSVLAGVATGMSWTFATTGVPQAVADTLQQITSSPFILLALVTLTLIVFASLLDGLPALIIFYPILSVTVAKYGIDPLHFGLIAVAALGIGLVVPPVGLLLVVVSQIGRVSLSSVTMPMLPYIAILIATLLVIASMPSVVLFLPRLLL
jgi:TRAP-type C4-dicarboxylate transport system permease large subunit